MKKFLALTALVLGLASCQTEPEGLDVNVGGNQETLINVSLPEATRSADSGIANVDFNTYDLRYVLEVYDMAYTPASLVDRDVKATDDTTTTFGVRLIPGREYRFVVFADFVANNSPADYNGDGLHHNITSLADIKVINDAINDECTDAYFDFEDRVVNDATPLKRTLTRPYGKVRVIATDYAELNNNVHPGSVVVSYDAAHVVSFNAVTGAILPRFSRNTAYSLKVPVQT